MSHFARESNYVASGAGPAATPETDLVSKIFASAVRNAATIAVLSLVLTTLLVVTYIFLVRPLFSAETYISSDRDTLVGMSVLLQSPLVQDAAAEKAGLNTGSRDAARAQMKGRITFRPAPGESREAARPNSEQRSDRVADKLIFLLDVKDPNAQTAHDLSNLIVDKWRDLLTPKAFDKKKLETALARQTKMKADLDNIIAHFDKEVTTYVTPQTNSGEVATPLVKLINQRAKLAETIENLQSELEAADKFVIVSGPTSPDRAQRPIGWATLILGSITVSLIIILGFIAIRLLWREMQSIRSQEYNPEV
jgi:hypothetical protein